MSQYFQLHPVNPQPRLIRRAVEILHRGGVIAYPTDSCFALGCSIGDKDAMERMRRIRRLDPRHDFTLVCRDLSELATYARVDNRPYRMLKMATPGPFTFILQATREVPRRLQNPRRRSIGLRVPANPIARALLEELGEPLISTTLWLPEDELPLAAPDEVRERLGGALDLVIDGGSCGVEPSTVVDLSGEQPRIARRGLGDPSTLFEFAP